MAAAVPYIIAVGGAALQAKASSDQRKEQRSILNAGLAKTAAAQDKASSALVAEAKNYSPADRQAALDAQQAATYAQSLKDLGPSASGIVDTAGSGGGAQSADFVKAKADSAITEGNRITDIARELSKVRAPGQQLTQEGIRRAGVQGDINSLFDSTRNVVNAGAIDAQNVEPPAYGTYGALASSIGGAMAANGFGKTAAPSSIKLPSNVQLGSNAGTSSFWSPNGARIRF